MSSINELREVRIEKLARLRDAGMNPYPESVPRTKSLKEIVRSFKKLKWLGKHSIAGRVMYVRGQGAILFVGLQEGQDKFQTVFKSDEMSDDLFKLFKDTVDIGDFISVTGKLFKTKSGQESLLAGDWVIATKSLLPLPEKWAGLQDVEERHRKRYLELITDEDTYDRFIKRAEVIRTIRDFFDKKEFLEVETPILQNQAGGAMAETFKTHQNDLDIDMHLRIALELEHKIIMAGGYPGIYEIGKNFRNEGSDPTHIQEFTMLEWYSAYHTLEDNMTWTEELLRNIAKKVFNKTKFVVWDNEDKQVEIDIAKDFPRITFNELLKKHAGIEVGAEMDEIKNKAREFGMQSEEIEKTGRGNLLDFIYKKTARKNIIEPTFVLDYPGELKPLAVQNNDGTAKIAQLIIAGAEMSNQYAELVDPIKQRELLEDQTKAKEGGDKEAMEVDERFITAMEHGMPPMTGFGMGIDRLVAMFTGQKNLREVIFFPIMRDK